VVEAKEEVEQREGNDQREDEGRREDVSDVAARHPPDDANPCLAVRGAYLLGELHPASADAELQTLLVRVEFFAQLLFQGADLPEDAAYLVVHAVPSLARHGAPAGHCAPAPGVIAPMPATRTPLRAMPATVPAASPPSRAWRAPTPRRGAG
jgi:hypothetical protein